MSDGTKSIPRISFDIGEDLRKKVQTHIPWGSIRPLMTVLLEEVISIIDTAGINNKNIIIGAIISKKISTIDVMRKKEE